MPIIEYMKIAAKAIDVIIVTCSKFQSIIAELKATKAEH